MIYKKMTHEIVESCKNKYKEKFKLNVESYDRLFKLCELAEILYKEFSAEDTEIKAFPEEINGEIIIVVEELVFDLGRSHQFFNYIKEADFLNFSKTTDGFLKISFGVYDLWKRY